MSDDLVTQIKERRLHHMYPHHLDELLNEAATALTEARAEIERLRGEVYVPGQWRCAKCKFVLQQANLNASTGTVTARDVAGDKCPNCNSPLWRVTWKQDAHEMLDRATEQMERAKAAESALSTLRDMLILCGELGGMKPGETMADYLRRLIDEVAAVESLRARVGEVVGLGLNVVSEERGWGTYRRMEGDEIYTEADAFRRAARQLNEEVK